MSSIKSRLERLEMIVSPGETMILATAVSEAGNEIITSAVDAMGSDVSRFVGGPVAELRDVFPMAQVIYDSGE
jgi:hypothetical protein